MPAGSVPGAIPARIAAGVLPALLGLLWWAALPVPVADGEERPADPPRREHRVVLERAPELIIVGNSLAHRGVDVDQLADRLEVSAGILWLASSRAPAWYAQLRNHVFGDGPGPRYVLVVNTLNNMLSVEPPRGRQLKDLRRAMARPEPVLDRKVFGGTGDSWVERLEAGRVQARDATLGLFRSLPVLLAGWGPADPVVESVFEADGAVADANARVIPIVELDRTTPEAVGDPSGSLLPDMLDLAEAHGARLAFVRLPVARRARTPMDRATEGAVVDLLNTRGAGWVDLHDLAMPRGAFLDDHHMSATGRQTFTRALADALLAIGFTEPGPIEAAVSRPSAPFGERVRTGRVPPTEAPQALDPCSWRVPVPGLAALSADRLDWMGLGAVGPLRLRSGRRLLEPRGPAGAVCGETARHTDAGFVADVRAADRLALEIVEDLPFVPPEGGEPAWWLPPGGAVVLHFLDGAEQIELGLYRFGAGSQRVVATVGGDRIPLGQDGRWLRGRRTVPVVGPWSLRIRAATDAPWLLLRSVALTRDGEVEHPIGRPASLRPSLRFIGGQATAWLEDPPPPPAVAQGVVQRSRGVRRVEVRGLDAVDREALAAGARAHDDGVRSADRAMGWTARCSPVRVSQDGTPLRVQRVDTADVRSSGPGSYVFVGGEVVFRPRQTEPGAPEPTFEVQLDPDRVCGGYRWLYPGDGWTLYAGRLGTLHSGAAELVLDGYLYGEPGDHAVDVVIRTREQTHAEARIPYAEFAAGRVVLVLDPPLPPLPAHLALDVKAPDGAPFLLLSNATLNPKLRAFGR